MKRVADVYFSLNFLALNRLCSFAFQCQSYVQYSCVTCCCRAFASLDWSES